METRFFVLRWALFSSLSSVGLAQQPALNDVPSAPQMAAMPSDFGEPRKLMQQGKVDQAIAELQAMEARDPNAKGLAFEMGSAYYKKNDFPQAIAYLKKA